MYRRAENAHIFVVDEQRGVDNRRMSSERFNTRESGPRADMSAVFRCDVRSDE